MKPGPLPTAQSRSVRLDNTKTVLILLVVFGHLIEPAAYAGGPARTVYGTIYFFHMPAFAMVSGYLSRPRPGRQGLKSILRRLVLPLLILQVLYWPVMSWLVPGRAGDLLTPHWILWFLASLATWRLVLPLAVGVPFVLPLAIVAALSAGWFDTIGRPFSLSRSVVFFPAFLFGHLYLERVLSHLNKHRGWCGVSFILLSGMAALIMNSGQKLTPLYGSTPYAAYSDHMVAATAERAIIIAAGLFMSVLLIAALPGRRPISPLIARETFAIYVLHGFAVILFWVLAGTGEGLAAPEFMALCAVLALAMAVLLAAAGQTWTRLAAILGRWLRSWRRAG